MLPIFRDIAATILDPRYNHRVTSSSWAQRSSELSTFVERCLELFPVERDTIRIALGLLCCWSLMAADLTRLRQIEETKRIFEMRRTLEQPVGNEAETLYYRAMVAARFGQEAVAIEQLRAFLATGASAPLERKARAELASAFARLGQYGSAATEWAETIRLMPQNEPGRDGTENTAALFESLREVAPQTIEFGPDVPVKAQHNPFGSWNVPVEVNGRKGEWIFDTGANISTLTESEAMRMGLSIREAGASVTAEHTGKANAFRLAVAGDLHFGSAHLRNVVFLVLTNDALRFGKYQMRGLLGLPVLRALGSVGISSNGTVRIRRDSRKVQGDPNLFFDDLSLIVEVSHGGHPLQMLLDTGANKGYLYPSFRDALEPEERRNVKKQSETSGGAGGIIHQMVEIVPALQLQIAGKVVRLKKISLRQQQPTGSGSYLDGLIGMDAMRNGFTLDFTAMQLHLE